MDRISYPLPLLENESYEQKHYLSHECPPEPRATQQVHSKQGQRECTWEEASQSVPCKSHTEAAAARNPREVAFCRSDSLCWDNVSGWEVGEPVGLMASPPDTTEEMAGRKKTCLPGRPDANLAAAHLKSKNTPILILVLFVLKKGPQSDSLWMDDKQENVMPAENFHELILS